MAVATKSDILDYLDSIDLNELLDRMENYVRDRFYNKSEDIREGFDYVDFCYNVLVKASNGIRNWDKDKVSFEDFVFGCLRSDLYNFFRKLKTKKNGQASEQVNPVPDEVYLIEVNEYVDLNEAQSDDEPPDLDFTEIAQDVLASLKEQGADELEEAIFECWLEGYYKPQEIADLCYTTTIEVNNAVKRLTRKTIKLRKKWISLKK